MITGHVKFFDAKRFGYYRRGQYVPAFGSINSHLSRLKEWALLPGRTFINTVTYQPNINEDLYRTFFSDWVKDDRTEDSVLILWNEIPNDGGVIYGMPPNSVPGQTQMEATSFENEAIPGMPSYYWFVPEHNLVASIKFEHSAVGKLNVERYIKSYLSNLTLHGVVDDAGDHVIGYAEDGIYFEGCESIHPQLELKSRKDDHIRQKLVNGVEDITRFIRKERLDYNEPDTRGMVERFFSRVLNEAPVLSDRHDVNFSFHFKPTLPQLNQIIDNYNRLPEDSFISDIGFKMGSQTVMLSGLNLAVQYDFNLNRIENEIISARLMLDSLLRDRVRLLRLAQLN